MPLPEKCGHCPFSEWRDSEPQGYFCFHPAFTSNRHIGDGDQEPARIRAAVGARAPDWCPKENPMAKNPRHKFNLGTVPGRNDIFHLGPFELLDFSMAWTGDVDIKLTNREPEEGVIRLPQGKIFVDVYVMEEEGGD